MAGNTCEIVIDHNERDTAPKCLNDPSLSDHRYLHTKYCFLLYSVINLIHYNLIVVAIDMRGYGDSDKPLGIAPYTIDHLTGDLRDAIPALGYSSCVLVAHDWGAAVAWQFAMEYPDLVDKLIIMNGPHPKRMQKLIQSSRKQFFMSWYMFFFQLPYLPEFVLSMSDYNGIKAMFHGRGVGLRNRDNITADDLEAFKHNCQREGALTAMINYYRAALRYTPKLKSAVITSPTLLIWGEEDTALDIALTEGLEKYVHDINVKLIPGASHWVQQDQPELVNDAMHDFLQG
uniref:Epoxide hydrolase 4-like n=1 Tax=Saccoglossus kowalevskii TaxID=10224 RepID=A0ABM0MKU2_SACKO|nr:PREDICTED: epoxide hydrolase 4-like [Saccoglossus kowalevskii]